MRSIQTKKIKIINNETLIVSVDIGKAKNFGYCRCPNGIDIKPFGFHNNGHGLKYLWDKVTQMKKAHNLKEIVIGFDKNLLPEGNSMPIEIVEWSEETEVEEISSFSVGIMPLDDKPWSHGKCGLKLIQYMGCGIPVIASPIGANNIIVDNHRIR